MIKKIIIVLMIAITGISACVSKKKSASQTQNTTASTPQEIVSESTSQKDSLKNIIVSFISIGSGTDGKTRTSFLALIDTFQKEKNISLAIDVRRWGREGEVDYCINTTTLNATDLKDLSLRIKKIVAESSLVNYYENKSCRKER